MLVLLLVVRRFILPAWYAPPLSQTGSTSLACRSWGCGLDDPICSDALNDIFSRYRNETLDLPLGEALNKTCPQARCVEAQLLLGVGEFAKDLTRSWTLANSDNSWLCQEVATFHPLTEISLEKLFKCSDSGSLRCMLVLSKTLLRNGNYTGALKFAEHIASLMGSEWHHERRSGSLFADTVKSILLSGKPHQHPGWKVLRVLADEWHYPAMLWLGDAVLKGATDVISEREIAEMLVQFIEDGPWRLNTIEVVNTKDKVDRKEILELYARFGDEASAALLSFPFMYE